MQDPHDEGEADLAERFEPDPVIETYKKDVDRTLLREQLRRPVDVRVRNMIAAWRFAEELRRAGARGDR